MTSASAAAAATTQQDADPTMQMIKLSSVVDQADDREVRLLEQGKSIYAVFKQRMGDYPRPEEDVTPEHLAALRALFSNGAPPYVDLAVWGPYGRRIQRKLRFSGQVLGASGVLHAAQLYGPPSVCEWQACWAIFQTGAIMLEVLSAATLDLWERRSRIMPVDTTQRLGL